MSKRLILLVEDQPLQAEAWEKRLRQAEYQVMVAGGADQAIEMIDNCYFHVAVIDQSLIPEPPGEDTLGLDKVVHHLKQQIEKQILPDVPYIILTAYAGYDPLKKAYGDFGVFTYINKLDADAGIQLLQKVAEAFETRVRCNFDLEIHYQNALSLNGMVEGLRLTGVDLGNREIKETINKEMRDLFGKLFHHCSRIDILPLKEGHSGAGVATVLPYGCIDGKENQLPYELIKYGDISKIRREEDNYSKYADRIQEVRRPNMKLSSRTKSLGGVRYTFLGMPLEKAADFHTTYLACEGSLDDQINRVSSVLYDVFTVAFDLWYGQPGLKHHVKFKGEYADRLLKIPYLQAQFEKTFPDWKDKHLIRLPKLGPQEFRSFVYELPDLPMKPIIGYDQVVTHGDLNGNNILVYDNKAWLIDFYHSGPGHIFRDFIKLESYIKFHLMETEDIAALGALEDALNDPEPSPDNTAFAIRGDREDLIKAYRIILKLRDWGCVKAMKDSWSKIRAEYYTGLFYQTLAVLQYDDIKLASKKHALVSANKIYNLLVS